MSNVIQLLAYKVGLFLSTILDLVSNTLPQVGACILTTPNLERIVANLILFHGLSLYKGHLPPNLVQWH